MKNTNNLEVRTLNSSEGTETPEVRAEKDFQQLLEYAAIIQELKIKARAKRETSMDVSAENRDFSIEGLYSASRRLGIQKRFVDCALRIRKHESYEEVARDIKKMDARLTQTSAYNFISQTFLDALKEKFPSSEFVLGGRWGWGSRNNEVGGIIYGHIEGSKVKLAACYTHRGEIYLQIISPLFSDACSGAIDTLKQSPRSRLRNDQNPRWNIFHHPLYITQSKAQK